MDELKQSCHELSLPVTEKCNPISRDIDRVNGKQMVQILRKCDAEIFEKKNHDPFHQRLYSSPVIQTMVDVAKRVEMMLRDPEESLIVLSGCGTSGRIAFLLVTSFNEMVKAQKQKQICSYIIAPFVAGQLDFCLKHLDVFTPVLLGFNPVHMARSEPMQDCSFHFKDVAERMIAEQRHKKAFVLNPVLGAEAISGSSRMKGGSATKIILESILLAGHEAAFRGKRMVYETTYSHSDELAALIHQAGESLQMKAHVYYIGWQTLGIIGLTDASECVPTFGAGAVCSAKYILPFDMFFKCVNLTGPEFVIGHKDFVDTILPSLSQNDMMLFLFTVNDDLHEVTALADQVRRRTSNLHAIAHDLEKFTIPVICNMFGTVLHITWSFSSEEVNSVVMRQRWELSTKWCLNAISTGAHVLKGKVYMNYMIDLRVTNSKLYRRAINILQRFTGCSKGECERALLRAIYSTDDLSEDMTSADVWKHTDAANRRDQVVPTALVMIQCGCTLAEARHHLDCHPVIRDAVSACFSSSKTKSTMD
uniref:Glucokinase (hexokinase 4) regulator n=1 Tax=Cyprinus carpio TaxID=7962 RepID=A0A8C2FJF0_CYPCA